MPQPPRTYSHLATLPRKPTRYDIATGALDYRADKPFEVELPLGDWYRQYRQESPFQSTEWETFVDPRQTDYTAYVRLQQSQEAHVDGVLRSMEESAYDRDQPPAARALLERVLAPLRFPLHGFQMVAAYVGHMAPTSRITIAALLQAADETRRIQRIAYRMAQIRQVHPSFGEHSLAAWQDDPLWQPLRELVERLLVAYDWGEAFVALNVCIKPLLDDLFMLQLPLAAKSRGDFLLGQLASSLNRDCDWHRQWTAALLAIAMRGPVGCRRAVQRWWAVWSAGAERAADAFAAILGEDGASLVATSRARALSFAEQCDLVAVTA